MNVSLTNELERWIEARVRSGLYRSASEVVREALRLLHEQEELRELRREELRHLLREGIADLDSGRSEILTKDLAESIKRDGRAHRNAKKSA
ncbi:MAG: type II toxin-antitoxin system ParD family antitoxin [Deltaproteobacteria bacterium]|nr:type II toxin-antitoxin system ParD family antitoxin [Deltaproteobacteria bacterium]